MASHIAFLRGINVSGHRMIPMADLRKVAGELGFGPVRTHIQTGNVLFDTAASEAKIRNTLEPALKAAFGYDIPVAVRSRAELGNAIADCPYAPADGEVVYVGFFVSEPDPAQATALLGRLPESTDMVRLGERHLYVLYRSGVHTSPLSNAMFERRLKVPVTARNLSTLRRLDALAGS